MNINFKYKKTGRHITTILLLLAATAFTRQAIAQTGAAAKTTTPPETTYDSSLAYLLAALAIILLLVIAILGRVFLASARIRLDREKAAKKLAAGTVLLLLSIDGIAQGTAATAMHQTVSANTIYYLFATIGFEFIVVLFLALQTNGMLRKEAVASGAVATVKRKSWFDRIYKQNTEEDIIKLDLGHNYDGIKELDNNIPIWWKIAFAATILFAPAYLVRYHLSGSAPLQQEELRIALTQAEERKAEYLKTAANNVDENTVKMLEAADIAEGKTMFHKPGACLSCHGENGSGIVNGAPGVGPNLTDNYWLHKGSIKDVFYSIKYGWPEKGMRSWKEEYTPLQIAQLASYIKSIGGTQHPAAKEKQGELYTDGNSEPPVADSVKK